MSITEVTHLKSQPVDQTWKPYDTANSSHSKAESNHSKSPSSFENRSGVRKAKMSQVVSELKARGLPIFGSADERRSRLMDCLFPKGTKQVKMMNLFPDTKPASFIVSSDEEPIVEKVHKRRNNRWGKMLRKSLGSFPQGKLRTVQNTHSCQVESASKILSKKRQNHTLILTNCQKLCLPPRQMSLFIKSILWKILRKFFKVTNRSLKRNGAFPTVAKAFLLAWCLLCSFLLTTPSRK
jgi:hypothetical protein